MPKLDENALSQILPGTWSPQFGGDANMRFDISVDDEGVQVSAVDVYDGERLEVSGVTWENGKLRFTTYTPSTRATVEHEIDARPGLGSRFRFAFADARPRAREEVRSPSN